VSINIYIYIYIYIYRYIYIYIYIYILKSLNGKSKNSSQIYKHKRDLQRNFIDIVIVIEKKNKKNYNNDPLY